MANDPLTLARAALARTGQEAALIVGDRRYTASDLQRLEAADELRTVLGDQAPCAVALLEALEYTRLHNVALLRVRHPYNVPGPVRYEAPPGMRLFILWPLPDAPELEEIFRLSEGAP